MATVTVKQFEFVGFNPADLPGILKVAVTPSTSSTFATMTKISQSAFKYEVRGTGFTYDDDGHLVSGNVTSITMLIPSDSGLVKAVVYTGITLDMARVVSTPSYNPYLNAALDYDASGLEPGPSGNGTSINATDLADTLRGTVGNDTFIAYLGNDKLYGGDGSDTLVGGGGEDRLYGEDGNDSLVGGDQADYLSGGSGNDTVGYSGETTGLVVNLADQSKNAGFAKGDTFSSIENVVGSFNSNKLTGNDGDNALVSWEGRDVLTGGAGNDRLMGGEGADTLVGGSGSDTAAYSVELASGRLKYTSGNGEGVTASLSKPTINTGDAEGDTYSSIENLRGTNYVDKLYGNTGNNILTGLDGNDTLSGASGDDVLVGGNGDDVLVGGNDEDRLIGGLGADDLTGGTSADEFVFDSIEESTAAAAGRDTIFNLFQSSG